MPHHPRRSRQLQRDAGNHRVDSVSPMDQSPAKDNRASPARRPSTPEIRGSTPVPAPRFVSFASTSELLIHLSRRVLEIVDARDYHNPFLNCLSPDMAVNNNDQCQTNGKERILRGHRALTRALPNYHVEIQHASAIVDDSAGRATVVLTMKVSGYAHDTTRQSVAQLTWTRHRDRWTCAAYNLMRGIEVFE